MADSREKRGAPRVHQLAGVVDQTPRGLDLDVHVRQHELDRLVFDDGLAELHALLGELDRLIQRPLRDAQRLRRDAWACAVERLEGDLEALAFLTQAIRDRNHAVLEDQFTGLRSADAHLVLDLAHAESRPVALDDEGADLLLAVFIRWSWRRPC